MGPCDGTASDVLTVGMLIQSPAGEVYRLLWLEPQRDRAFGIETNDRYAWPELLLISDLYSWIAQSSSAVLELHPTTQHPRLDDLTAAESDHYELALALIRRLVQHEPKIYFPKERGPLVRWACNEFGLSKPSVYGFLRRYWKSGKQATALLPRFRFCGAPGRSRVTPEASSGDRPKLGRPRDPVMESVGRNVTAEDVDNIRRALNRRYDEKERSRLYSAYLWYLMTFNTEHVRLSEKNDRALVAPINPDKIISFDQFCHHAEMLEDVKKRYIQRRGLRDYGRNARDLYSTNMEHVLGPGSRYEIDATILDVILRSLFDPNWFVGRVTLYLVADVFSRIIAGYYLTFEPPNWRAAAMALINTGTDKVKLCARYGVTIEPEEWPVADLPATLLTDNGEFKSKLADVLVRHGICDVENAPAGRPDLKGLVERTFRTLTADVAEYSPGAILKDLPVEKKRKPHKFDYHFDLNELNRFIIERILHHNRRVRKKFPMIPEMVMQKVPASPLDMWNWGRENLRTDSRRVSEDYLRLHLMPSVIAKVNRFGVRMFGHLYYSSDALRAERWYRKLQQANGGLEVAYHPGDMTAVKVKHPGDRECWFDCELLPRSSQFGGKSLSEIMAFVKMANGTNRKAAQDRLPKVIEHTQNTETIVAKAKAACKKDYDPRISDSTRARQQGRQRKGDAELTLKQEAGEFTLPALPEPTPGPSQRLSVDRYEQDMTMLEDLADPDSEEV